MAAENPNNEIAEVFYRWNVGVPVSLDMLAKAFKLILTDPHVKARDSQLGAFLSGLMLKGPTDLEVTTLIRTAFNVDGLTKFKPQIPCGERLVGVAGSGKKGLKTFNISTPACIVAATLGAYVAKTASSATSSLSGSRDLVRLVGANILTNQEMSEVLCSTGLGIFSIEDLIPKFDGIYGGKIFEPTPLSFGLPAIANPVVCDALLYGLSHPNLKLSLDVFKNLGCEEVIVVASSYDNIHYVDELTPLPVNLLGRIRARKVQDVSELPVPLITGHAACEPLSLRPGESILENIKIALDALDGKGDIQRVNTIALNAAAILVLANKAATIEEGFNPCVEAIRSGRCLKKLQEFIEATGGSSNALHTLLGGTL